MKKVKIFFYCLLSIFIIVTSYYDLYLELESIYWLAVKFTAALILLILMIVIRYKEDNIVSTIIGMCIWAIFLGYLSYRDINKYKRSICQDRFGLVFNKTRRKLGIPEIPGNWHVEGRGTQNLSWKANDTVGHAVKYINIDSTCRLESEEDFYNLKPINKIERDVSVFTKYVRGKSKDSIFYYYEAGYNNNNRISKQKADSILTAEKSKRIIK